MFQRCTTYIQNIWTMPIFISLQLQKDRMCVKSWRRFAKSMNWTRPQWAPGPSFAPATTAPWWQLGQAWRLGHLFDFRWFHVIYMNIMWFHMNICFLKWCHLTLYAAISPLNDLKWCCNVLCCPFNLETWNYCAHWTKHQFSRCHGVKIPWSDDSPA